ncbi:MAG: hypothetical protein V3T84_05265 [Phycisphaerales bacterium]
MNHRQETPGMLRRLRWWIALVLMVAIGPVTTSLAQDEGARRELEAAKQRIDAMMRKAEELQELGRLDAAEKVRQRAEQLGERIERQLDRRRHARSEETEHLHNVLDGLERGMMALRELGRHEELEALERVAHDVRRELEGRRDRPQRERQRAHRSENEREVAQHQLEIMRMAMPALREGERRDAADLLEHAIHARELGLEGRRDDEAQHIRETAPNRGQLSEILGLASRLWAGFGHEERAHAVGELAEQMRARVHRERDEHAQREQDRPRREARERRDERDRPAARERREQPDRYQAAMERIERLEVHMKRLAQAMERLQGRMHERERDRR